MTRSCLSIAVLLLGLLLINIEMTIAQQVVINEQQRSIETYPFGDPDPVPTLVGGGENIYPYFSFDRYSHESTPREWNVVRLENEYIKVFILPEVGGKIWGAIEKSTGNEFIYRNEVLKFRNIALRGPWTSGGIEFNFGIIGHTPTTSTPVDYLIRENEDGSVSCIIGALDLPSRTRWRVTITLPKNKAYFETKSFWYNPTSLNQSYYVWMNTAIRAAEDLQFFFPGKYYIGHSGDAHPWPVDNQGRNLSYYKNNDFGGNKSYHVLGRQTEFFGAYWHEQDVGFGHWSPHSNMPGKKLWVWSLARLGAIWEDLLTDTDGQYVEVQSGRQFSQAAWRSNSTPFDQAGFHPMAADQWRELWFPVKGTGGISAASPYGVLYVEQHERKTAVNLMALQPLHDELKVFAEGKSISRTMLSLDPMEVYSKTFDISADVENLRIVLGNNKLVYAPGKNKDRFVRPLETPSPIRQNTAAGRYQRAVNMVKSRNYREAVDAFTSAIEQDPGFTAAYTGLANLYFRRGNYQRALDYANQALSRNIYNADANYIYGAIKARTGEPSLSLEAFSWAARSPEYRSAAYASMAELYLKTGRLKQAVEFAGQSLDFNRSNLNAYKIWAISLRKQNHTDQAASVLNHILEIDPLNHFVRFEQYLLQPTNDRLHEFTSLIRNELPHETYLELAIFYANAGLDTEAVTVLKQASGHPMVYFWLAYMQRNNSVQSSERYLHQALSMSPYLVFPFRLESIPVLEWARQQDTSWKTSYYLGLIYWHIGCKNEASQLFNQLKERPDYAPFYLTRGALRDELDAAEELILHDYRKARQMDPGEWRTWYTLIDFYLRTGAHKQALNNAGQAYKKFPDQDPIEMDYAKSLLANGKYETCISLLEQMRILPFEGASEGHRIFEQAHILYALEKINTGQLQDALQHLEISKTWPEELGVGRPYNPDDRLQTYIQASLYQQLGQTGQAGQLFAQVATYTRQHPDRWGPGHYFGALALKQEGQQDHARTLLTEWQQARPHSHIAEWALASFDQDWKIARTLEQKTTASSTNSSFELLRKATSSIGVPGHVDN